MASAPAQPAARTRQVEMILERVDAIPTLSPIATRMLKLTSAGDVEIDEIAKIIETDPALTTRILGLCRRSDKGLGDRITTVKRAVVMLGLDAVRSAVLSVSVLDLVARDEHGRSVDASLAGDSTRETGGYDRKGSWKHAVAVACASEMLASEHRQLRIAPEEAFLAGLLHSIGRIVLSSILPRAYDRVVRLAEKRRCASSVVEVQLLGLDHHTAGRRVAQRWNLPACVQSVVWLHDQPREGYAGTEHGPLVALVTAARALCRELHMGWSGDFTLSSGVARAWRDAGLMGDPLALGKRLHEAYAERLNLLGIDQSGTPDVMLESLASATKQLSQTNAQLREQARSAALMQRVVDAIAWFQDTSAGISTLGELGTQVLEAWARVAPDSYSALLLSAGEGTDGADASGWLLVLRDGGGVQVRVLDEPPASARGAMLAMEEGKGAPIGAMGLFSWLSDALSGAPDVRNLHLVCLGAGAQAALLTDRAGVMDDPAMRALLSCFGAAVRRAGERVRADRLGEQLVQANRALAAAQEQLTQREAMAKLGETTAGAAHELNNPLTVISGRAELLFKRLQGERDKAAVGAIVMAARQIAEMIEALHLLSKAPVPVPQTCSLVDVAREAIPKAQRRARAKIEVSVDLAGVSSSIRTDPALLGSVLVELLCNALEVCPNGPVTLTGEASEEGATFVVTDAGPGMDEHTLRHAFDPFFSERESGRGRGLGLTRARVLAQALGGDVTLQSERGVGTRATLHVRALPRQ